MVNIFKKTNTNKIIKILSLLSVVSILVFDIIVIYMDFSILNFLEIVYIIIETAPPAIFLIYLFKFFEKLKYPIIIPGIFIVLIFKTLRDVFLLDRMTFFEMTVYLICYSLSLFCAFKGFNIKLLIIIPMIICIYKEISSLSSFFPIALYNLTWLLTAVGYILFFTGMLIFGLKNKIPSIISYSPEKEKSRAEKNPEQALKLLKDKLDLDMITEEEYQAQRANIISKL